MLRLVVPLHIAVPNLGSPTYHQYNRNAKYIAVSKRRNRIHDVAEAGVLQVHQWNVARGHVVADGKADGASFAACHDVLVRRE
ncbi:hypothetical protein GCM10027419_10200 [Pandoraea terrae]